MMLWAVRKGGVRAIPRTCILGDQAEGTSSRCEGSAVGGGGADGYCVFYLLFVSWAGCSGVLGLGMYSLGSFFWVGEGQTREDF